MPDRRSRRHSHSKHSNKVFSYISITVSALAFLAAADVEDRLRRATELFVKRIKENRISRGRVFFRQQLAAIQRELQSLQSSPASVGPGFGGEEYEAQRYTEAIGEYQTLERRVVRERFRLISFQTHVSFQNHILFCVLSLSRM